MIRWITEQIGTAKRSDVDDAQCVVDVRSLLDKAGNPPEIILEKIDEACDLIDRRQRAVICCDYGMSRSNAIAIGTLVRHDKYSFDDAVALVLEKTGETGINIEMLNSVREALEGRRKKESERPAPGDTILVTGATGFLGTALVPRLKKRNPVVEIDRREIDLLKGSVGLDVVAKKSNARTVIHLANPRIYTTTESMGHSLIMLKNVLDVCKVNSLRLVYLSSWVVYSGYRSSLLYASESMPLFPNGTYGETKALCEALVNHYREHHDLNIYVVRLSPVYGVGSDRPRFIHTFFSKALGNETISTHKYLNGLPVIDLLYRDDAADAIDALVGRLPDGSIDVNVGSGVGYSTLEIAKAVREICRSDSAIEHEDMAEYTPNVVMDVARMRRLFDWAPRTSLADGLGKIYGAIEKQRNTSDGAREKGESL